MICQYCNLEFETKSILANHIRWKHKHKNKILCDKCNKEFCAPGFNQHYNSCGLKRIRKRKEIITENPGICEYGCGLESKYKMTSGKWCCSKTFMSCPKIRKKNSNSHLNMSFLRGKTYEELYGIDKSKEIKLKISNKFKGKSFEELYGIDKSKEIKQKISSRLMGLSKGIGSTPEIESLRRKKISAKMKKYGGYRKGSGRGKQGWYKGYWCDSSYELAYVIYNLEHDILFERNKEKFEYKYEGKIHSYIPDFICNNEYIEIKGYYTDLVEEKLIQFPHKINIISHPKIDKYLDYAKSKYGKDFIKLYEKVG